jgi:N-acetylmuramoyl-L-alanine amidase
MRLIIIILTAISFVANGSTNNYYLNDIASDFNLLPVPEQCDNEFITYSNKHNKVIFKKFSRKLYFNNALYWLNDAFNRSDTNGWFVSEQDYTKMLMPLFVECSSTNNIEDFVVFIDPGHGGSDPGACHSSVTNLKESDIVFNISTNLARLLRDSGTQVFMSRTNDIFVGLADRTRMANEVNSSVYISIHVNSAFGTSASGFETFTLPLGDSFSTSGNSKPRLYRGNNNDIFNSLLAYRIHKSLLDDFPDQQDRGIKHARYEVLKNIKCPAILVECGFISNKAERELLSDIDYQRKISESIFRGTTNYINSITDVNNYILDKGIETIVYVEPALTNNMNSVTNDFQFADISSEQAADRDCETLEEKSKNDVLSSKLLYCEQEELITN